MTFMRVMSLTNQPFQFPQNNPSKSQWIRLFNRLNNVEHK